MVLVQSLLMSKFIRKPDFQSTTVKMCFYRYTSEKKKYQKAALGLQDSDEDDHEQVGQTDGLKG